MRNSIYLLFILSIIMACESPADVDLSPSTPTLVVDAFLNNKAEDQKVILNFSQSFFSKQQYQPATGATVTVTDNQGNDPLVFVESSTSGEYVWETSAQRQIIGAVDAEYTLRIEYGGEVYTASTNMNRTTTIEEILFFEEEEPFSDDIIYEGRIVARDLEGLGDAYWIKTFWNGEFLGDPAELNIAFDAGLSPGGGIDGREFIIPVKAGINPLGEDESYQIGDLVSVEIHSISRETYDYFIELQIQTDRPGGFAELFAQPLANLESNITPINEAESVVLGLFSVSAVSAMEVTFTEDLIR